MMNDNEIIRDFFMSRLERDGKSEALLVFVIIIKILMYVPENLRIS